MGLSLASRGLRASPVACPGADQRSGTTTTGCCPGLRRDDLLSNPWLMPDDGTGTWWRLTAAPARVP